MPVVVNLEDERKRKPSLDALGGLVAADLKRVNEIILARMQSKVPLIPELAGHIIAAGGKRLRPMLTLATARLCGHTGDRHLGLAASVEFIHTATLLHDDVVDESLLRRGHDTANAIWGNQASVLVGDFLFTRAFQLMVENGSLKVLDILSNASALIAEGEVAQLITSNDTSTTEQAYLDVIRGKTAQLFAAAARVGAIVAERPRAEADALESYGMNLGIAFQLVDDALDYAARQAELGKTVGDDFREGKITLPVILAFMRGSEDERRFWRRALEDGEQTEADLAEAIRLMERHGTIVDTLARARHYGAIARDALGLFPDHPIKRALAEAIDFAIERGY
ncbi:MAG: polyprenyl synthetase family protein [Alphaproteobacteria bacterium]|nr:polyprenyl synthetase family protein [Alphaproteobacteria bacterium]